MEFRTRRSLERATLAFQHDYAIVPGFGSWGTFMNVMPKDVAAAGFDFAAWHEEDSADITTAGLTGDIKSVCLGDIIGIRALTPSLA
jgi:hypothetical protein